MSRLTKVEHSSTGKLCRSDTPTSRLYLGAASAQKRWARPLEDAGVRLVMLTTSRFSLARFTSNFVLATIAMLWPVPGTEANAASSADPHEVSELPSLVVNGAPVPKEELPLGPHGQPEWTVPRRFATTRVYVLPPWHVETELGWRTEWPDHGRTKYRLQEEVEIGLPYRFQLDIENADNLGHGSSGHAFNAIELRYALAGWNEIPLNPTINVEWKFADSAADAFEVQLLTGGELVSRWHWGSDIFFENQIGDDEEREFAWSVALSYLVVDSRLSAGAEFKAAVGWDETNDDAEYEFLLGPSIQWRPLDRVHVDVVPLFGLGADSPVAQLFVFIGVDFGAESEVGEVTEPASLRGR